MDGCRRESWTQDTARQSAWARIALRAGPLRNRWCCNVDVSLKCSPCWGASGGGDARALCARPQCRHTKLLIRSGRVHRPLGGYGDLFGWGWTVAASKGSSLSLRGNGHKNKPCSREWNGDSLAAGSADYQAACSILSLVLSCCVRYGAAVLRSGSSSKQD